VGRRCAGTRSDGTACRNRVGKGSGLCRRHETPAEPVAVTGKVAGGARALWTGSRQDQQPITAEEAAANG
jgi:hypothetical protein